MIKRLSAVLCTIIMIVGLFAVPLFAEEKKLDLNELSTLKDVLKANIGKRIIVKLDGSEDLEGTVVEVTDKLVLVSKLSKRDFYDAYVRIDRISSIIFRARGN